jgi:outer membrane protein insertion porin family
MNERSINRSVIYFLLIVLITVTTSAATQDSDEVISDIIVEGNKRVPTEMVLTYITLEAGDTFDQRIVQNDFRALWNTELFSDIEILRRPDGTGGIILVIRVDERPKIREIRFEGLKAISESKIEEKMQEPPNELSIPEGSVLSYAKLSELKQILLGLMEEAGLEFGEVTYELRPVEESEFEVDVVFLVNEGGKVKIADVMFLGNESFSQWELTRVLQKSRPTWIFSWIQKDNIYSSKLLNEDLEELRRFYAENGFLRVAVKEPIIEALEDKPLLSGRDMRARIVIPVNEGIRYRINKITFNGNEMIRDDIMKAMFKLKEGDLYNKKKIDDSIEQIGEIYKNQGYIEAFLAEQISYPLDKRGHVDLEIQVSEGQPFFVGTIDFAGNRTTRDKVLRRNIFLIEGSPFNLKAFQDSLRRLTQLGFFGSVDQDLDIDRENQVVNVRLEVTETGRNQIQFGGGYSGVEGGFFNFAFTTQNFWGQGQTLSFLVQTGARNDNYEISFFEPWLFNRPIGAGITFFSRNFEFNDFVRRGDGGRVSMSLRLSRFISLFTEYRYELVEIRNPEDVPFTGSIFFPEGRTATGSITPTIIRNTVDHPLLPTRGHKDTFRFEYGASFLGGDFDFYKLITEHISNFPVTRNNIFRFRVQVGWAETIGEGTAELPVFERFFMGGENTIRGYELRTVGPRDEFGRIVGGTKSILFNIENNFLLTNELRIVPFLDGGNAFSDEINFDNIYYSAGIELRFFVPVMNIPFRFIYAKPINPEDFHRKSSFQFTIGSIF